MSLFPPTVNGKENPAVRLAYHPEGGRTLSELDPTVRLAVCPASEKGGANSAEHHVTSGGLGFPAVRLAHIDGAQGDCTLKGEKGVPQIEFSRAPGLLISYYYLEPFLKQQSRYCYRDWVLDSGAFSAKNSGKEIILSQYIDKCLELLSTDRTLTEVFALDVIPESQDPKVVEKAAEQSLKNCEEMWRQGISAIPCYHLGEREEHLYHIAKTYPKIALGGVALLKGDLKLDWLTQCFARVWPCRIHGFGMANEDIVFNLPFHSVDATTWELEPCAFARWHKFGTMSVRGSNQDLRTQVDHYLELEAKARVRWRRQMDQLDALPTPWPPPRPAPTVRLVANGNAGREDAKALAFSNQSKPTKLAAAKPEEKKVEKEKEPAQTKEMDGQWVDYWKRRL